MATGTVKWFNDAKGFGFITQSEDNEDVFVHHFGRASFSKIQQERYQRIFDENKIKYEQKWGVQWIPHKSRRRI